MKKHIEVFLNKDTTLPMMVGIAGGSGSGKSTITNKIFDHLGLEPTNNSLCTDYYMVALWKIQDALKELFGENFLYVFNAIVDQDNWARYNGKLLCKNLLSIKSGAPTVVPAELFPKNPVKIQTRLITPSSPLFITEGLFALHPEVKDFNDFNFFIKITKPEQKQRIRNRFITGERTKPPENVLIEKLNKIWGSHTNNIVPTASNGDFLIQNKQSDSDRTTKCITEVITTLENARDEFNKTKHLNIVA